MLFKDFSNKNLQKAKFRNVDLTHASFNDCDLRGADFTGADLRGADLSHVKTGIAPVDKVLLFLLALVVSALSGYIAMLTGHTVQMMLNSPDSNVRLTGVITLIFIFGFLVYAYMKGGNAAIKQLAFPACFIALLVGVLAYAFNIGTGMGALYLILSLFLAIVMMVVGTVARAIAGSLSNILFIVVALAGGMFGRSVGGGMGTLVMAVGCALIAKKALKGAEGFGGLQAVAAGITRRFGTSFRNSRLADSNFSRSELCNTDFSNADVSYVNWGDSKKTNCIIQNEKDGRRK